MHYTFKALDVDAFERALAGWAAQIASGKWGKARDTMALAPPTLDGKGLRGIHGEELPGVRLVALYDLHAGVMLAQKWGQDSRRE